MNISPPLFRYTCDYVMQLESMSSSDETQAGEVESTTGGTYAERRKSSKPIMEKRRRARINSSLNELKSILLEALKKDSTRHSKLEKADILEMTVKYLKNVERQQRLSVPLSIDPSVVDKYKAGFNECRNEVMRFLSTCEGVTVDVRTRLLNHLASCLQAIQTQPSIFDESPVNLDVAHQSIQATPLFSNGQAIQVHFSEAAVPIALNRGHHNPIIAPKRPILKQAITGQEQPITVVHTSGHSNTTPSVVLPDSIQIASSISGFGSPNIAFLLPSGGNTTTALLRPVTDSPNQLSPEQPLVLRRLSPSSTSPSPRKKSIAEGRDSPSTDRKIKLSEKFSSQEILNKDTSTFSTSQFALNLDTPKTLKRHRLIGTEIKQFTNYVESVPADSTVPKRRRYESKDWDNTKTACQGVIDDVHPNVLEEINFSAYKDDCHGEDESSTCQRQSEFEYSDESPLGSKEQTSADRNTIPYPDETCSPNVNSQKVHKSEPWRPWSKAKVVSE